MRIKKLATRSTKMYTGSSYMPVDNGIKVEKVDFTTIIKQGIEEYTGSTLAGVAQTIKAAFTSLHNSLTTLTTNVTTLTTNLGALADLQTTAKGNVVAAINEVNTKAENPASPEEIRAATTEYLEEHPVDVSSLALGILDDGNGNITLLINADTEAGS